MPIRFSAGASVRLKSQAQNRSGRALLALLVGLAATTFLLWLNRQFIDYAVTGIFWSRTDGIVTDPKTTDTPHIQFSSADANIHLFKEDYILLCGSRYSFCFIRDFSPGEVVPVVYDPKSPMLAFVCDWALTANVISVFIEAGIWLLLVMILIFPGIVGRSVSVSTQLGSTAEHEQGRPRDL